jgi:hypothetical protein
MSMRAVAACLALGAGLAWAAPDAGAQAIHGVADAFAQPGVALAWGVLRGKSDADAIVVVRVETTAPAYAFVAVDAIDPFTQQRKVVQAPIRAASGVDLRIPRTRFADFPRTEFKFAGDEQARTPALVVYYLGVPDTTPEFPTQAALSRYFADRLARERAATGTSK